LAICTPSFEKALFILNDNLSLKFWGVLYIYFSRYLVLALHRLLFLTTGFLQTHVFFLARTVYISPLLAHNLCLQFSSTLFMFLVWLLVILGLDLLSLLGYTYPGDRYIFHNII
jgi:hypothetical protein